MPRKNIYKDAKSGFDKKPENINRTGANRRPISAILKELMEEKIVEFEVRLTNAEGKTTVKKGKLESKTAFNEVIAYSLVQKAMSGDLKAIEIMLDRTEGKPTQKTENEHTIKEHPKTVLEFFDTEPETEPENEA